MNVYCIKHNEEHFYHAGLCIVTANSKDEALNIFGESLYILPEDLYNYDVNIIESLSSTETKAKVICYSFE